MEDCARDAIRLWLNTCRVDVSRCRHFPSCGRDVADPQSPRCLQQRTGRPFVAERVRRRHPRRRRYRQDVLPGAHGTAALVGAVRPVDCTVRLLGRVSIWVCWWNSARHGSRGAALATMAEGRFKTRPCDFDPSEMLIEYTRQICNAETARADLEIAFLFSVSNISGYVTKYVRGIRGRPFPIDMNVEGHTVFADHALCALRHRYTSKTTTTSCMRCSECCSSCQRDTRRRCGLSASFCPRWQKSKEI